MAAASTAVFADGADTSKASDEQETTATQQPATTATQQAATDDMGSAGREPTSQGDMQRADDTRDRWIASIWASP